jgi:hypothetical protein
LGSFPNKKITELPNQVLHRPLRLSDISSKITLPLLSFHLKSIVSSILFNRIRSGFPLSTDVGNEELFFDVRIGTILAFNFFNQPKCPAMKKCILGIFAFISVHTIHAQVSKNLKSADLSSFLLQSQTDEILKKERD